jgi:hypothetical protein
LQLLGVHGAARGPEGLELSADDHLAELRKRVDRREDLTSAERRELQDANTRALVDLGIAIRRGGWQPEPTSKLVLAGSMPTGRR